MKRQKHRLQSNHNLNHQKLYEHKKKRKLDRFEEPKSLNIQEDVMGSKTTKKLVNFFINVTENKRKTCLTNSIAMSISITHKTKLSSNSVLVRSLSYCPKWDFESQILPPIETQFELQLTNSIVPEPYMILMQKKLKQDSKLRLICMSIKKKYF